MENPSSRVRMPFYICAYVCMYTALLAPRNENRSDYVGCYGQDGDASECQSGRTYQCGFRDARQTLETPVGLYENVRDVLFQRQDKKKVKHPPEIETVQSDMISQGCSFAYAQVDTAKFLLPQRRTRVYGVFSENDQRPDLLQSEFEEVMTLFQSDARWVFSHRTHMHTYIKEMWDNALLINICTYILPCTHSYICECMYLHGLSPRNLKEV